MHISLSEGDILKYIIGSILGSQGGVAPRAVRSALLQSVLTLHLWSSLEPEMAIQMMVVWFHGWEHSWITPLAVVTAGGVTQKRSTVEEPEKHKYFPAPVFPWFGSDQGWPRAPRQMCPSDEQSGATPEPVQLLHLITNLFSPIQAVLYCPYECHV